MKRFCIATIILVYAATAWATLVTGEVTSTKSVRVADLDAVPGAQTMRDFFGPTMRAGLKLTLAPSKEMIEARVHTQDGRRVTVLAERSSGLKVGDQVTVESSTGRLAQ